jgi:hypothetical protein
MKLLQIIKLQKLLRYHIELDLEKEYMREIKIDYTKKNFIKCLFLLWTIFLTGCNNISHGNYNAEPLSLVHSCENEICKSVMYDLKLSLYNLELMLHNESYPPSDVIKFCLTKNVDCGYYVFYSLQNLYQTDSIKFNFLTESFNLNSQEDFVDQIYSSNFIEVQNKITSIYNTISDECKCK